MNATLTLFSSGSYRDTRVLWTISIICRRTTDTDEQYLFTRCTDEIGPYATYKSKHNLTGMHFTHSSRSRRKHLHPRTKSIRVDQLTFYFYNNLIKSIEWWWVTDYPNIPCLIPWPIIEILLLFPSINKPHNNFPSLIIMTSLLQSVRFHTSSVNATRHGAPDESQMLSDTATISSDNREKYSSTIIKDGITQLQNKSKCNKLSTLM